jgi:hypothetical protein
MRPKDFEKRLRYVFNLPTLTVRRNALWARRNGLHPDAWQVWDTGQRMGNYCIFVCEQNHNPVEPNELMIEMLRRRWHESNARVEKARVDELVRVQEDEDAARERKSAEQFDERFKHEFAPAARFALGGRKVFPVAKPREIVLP